MVIGTDGILIEKLMGAAKPNMEAVAASIRRCCARASRPPRRRASGALQKPAITTQRLTTLPW